MDNGLASLQKQLPDILEGQYDQENNDHNSNNGESDGGNAEGNSDQYVLRFFENFHSSGTQLSSEEIVHLMTLTRSICHGDEATELVSDFQTAYAECPGAFWEQFSGRLSTISDEDSTILSIFTTLSQFDSHNALARRLLSRLLFEKIEAKAGQLRAHPNESQPKTGQSFRDLAIESIIRTFSTGASSKKDKKLWHRRIRAGEKWFRLEIGVLVGIKSPQWTMWASFPPFPALKANIFF